MLNLKTIEMYLHFFPYNGNIYFLIINNIVIKGEIKENKKRKKTV